eukprot:TRINITY_DN2707_c0_g1_i2.p1 TRINITY_DN2707_c0_g1~~TRINITY_DN2707_c0_g1_i2.p1  ORF type:complete len:294 (-),score=68.23 TRINITY_DN2707_c0_g1_i2:1913-2794(-)
MPKKTSRKALPDSDDGGSGDVKRRDTKAVRAAQRTSPNTVSALPITHQGNQAPMELLDLDDHAVSLVFFGGYLDSMYIIQSLRLVSKRISKLGSSSRKLLDLHTCKLTSPQLESLAKAFPLAEEVDLSFCRELDDACVAALTPTRDTLQMLYLRGCGATNGMLAALPQFNALQELDISQAVKAQSTAVDDEHALALCGLTNLTSLNVAWNARLTDESVGPLVRGLPRLKRLDLSLLPALSTDTTAALISATQLEWLSLRGCTFGDGDIAVILANCKQVRTMAYHTHIWMEAFM